MEAKKNIKTLLANVIKHPKYIYKAVVIFLSSGTNAVDVKIKNKFFSDRDFLLKSQYELWLQKHVLDQKKLGEQKEKIREFKVSPKVSVIIPTYDTTIKYLKECIDSVIAQSYRNWELCIADDASTKNEVRDVIKDYSKSDKRIKFIFRKENGHICRTSNDALGLATGEFVALLDHDDYLWPNALFEVVKAINKNRKAEFIYSDEDKLEEDGKTHSDPFFKPDWSPDYLRSVNYITHFAVIKKNIVDKIGGFRVGLEGAQDWDLFLRASREIQTGSFNFDKKKIVHIPTILYSWRKSNNSTASEKTVGRVKTYAVKSQKKVLEDDLTSRNMRGLVKRFSELGYWRVKYDLIGNPKISIVIPTKDKYKYIVKCLDSLLKKTTYQNFEIIIVDTGSSETRVWEFYKQVKKRHPDTKIIEWTKGFNFSEVCNLGVEQSLGDYVILLNNDTEVITGDWIEGMLEHAQRKSVGSVGCKLLYPDKRIQHAGIILGIKGGEIKKGVAGHAFKYFENNSSEKGMISGVRNYSGVTAACLMVEKKKYLQVGGQDPTFKIAFNDVDFNLKLMKVGYYNVYTGFVKLFHHESISVEKPGSENRNLEVFQREIDEMQKRWGKLLQDDPFYNRNLTLEREDFTLRT